MGGLCPDRSHSEATEFTQFLFRPELKLHGGSKLKERTKNVPHMKRRYRDARPMRTHIVCATTANLLICNTQTPPDGSLTLHHACFAQDKLPHSCMTSGQHGINSGPMRVFGCCCCSYCCWGCWGCFNRRHQLHVSTLIRYARS